MKKTTEERLSQHDREIAAIRKLMLQGMKMLVRSEKRIDALTAHGVRTDQRIDALTKRVDQLTTNVNKLVKSLERGSRNGHS